MMSDWYKDKIIYPKEDNDFHVKDLNKFISTNFGFVREDLKEDKDVLRGLVPLAVPQNNINCISFRELRYIYYRRGEHTTAAPELKLMMEELKKDLIIKNKFLGEYLDKVWSETEKDFINIGEAVYAKKD